MQNFIHGASYKVHNLRQREALSQSALTLLRTLPTARHAVLEYMANVFDEAVNSYLLEMDIGHSVNGKVLVHLMYFQNKKKNNNNI